MDREKLIEELDSGILMARATETKLIHIYVEQAEEILTLLKDHDAVEPIAMQRMDGNFSFFVPYFLCGNCRYELVGKDVMFCSHCGQAVKWE